MMGNLFYRRVPVDILRDMGFKELCYWNEWHDLMAKAERSSVD